MDMFVDVSFEHLCKHGEELCGDKVEVAHTDNSLIMVMADGLGSGVKANILSTLTTRIIATMLKGGASIEDAVQTMSATLPICKVRGIAYSTFTILQVFKDGWTNLIEYDNPPIFLLKNGKCVQYATEERLINGKLLRESRFKLDMDDMIIVVSDGAVHAGIGQTLNLGWRWNDIASYIEKNSNRWHSAQKMAKLLINTCNSLYLSMPGDDTTVAVLHMKKAMPVTLLSGPPLNPSDDEAIVRKFMERPGKKVVCGGTTAQITARVLGKEVKTYPVYYQPNVPPMGYIDGIDIVTEGILTLAQTAEYLEKYLKNEITRIRDQNAAAQLARFLIEECTDLYIMAGMAVNPAHQNPDLPFDLNIKHRIIQRLADALAGLGKTVKIERF